MSESSGSEEELKKLWRWLQDAEDSLEQTIEKYNELVRDKQKLERREFVREILIRSLRQDVRKKDRVRETAEVLASSTELLLNWEREKNRLLKEALKRARKDYAEQQKMISVQAVLHIATQRKSRSLASRVRELHTMIDHQAAEIVRLKAVSSVSSPLKLDSKTNIDVNVQGEISNHLQVELEQLSKEMVERQALIEEQHAALLEWEEAYAKLEKEIGRLSSELEEARTRMLTSENKPTHPLVSTSIPQVHIEKTNGTVHTLIPTSESNIEKDSRKPSQPENQLSSVLKSALKIISKM